VSKSGSDASTVASTAVKASVIEEFSTLQGECCK